jgi:putative flippase GtrA
VAVQEQDVAPVRPAVPASVQPPAAAPAQSPAQTGTRLAQRAGEALTWLVDRLPAGLRRYLPRELVGFLILGGFTFLVDLALLATLRRSTQLPLPVDVSVAYLTAFGLNYVLNRTVNFRSHAPVGGQVLRYATVVVADFLITLGITTGLSYLGLDFRIARLIAAACVAVFTYSTCRWWVFRDTVKPPLQSIRPTPLRSSGR